MALRALYFRTALLNDDASRSHDYMRLRRVAVYHDTVESGLELLCRIVEIIAGLVIVD